MQKSRASLVRAAGLSILLSAICMAGAHAESYRQRYPLPQPGVPGSLGVNIHFTDPQHGEMKLLAAEGFRWVRMDFVWSSTEQVKGQYDFSAYDRLMSHLDKYHIRPIFILDYGNDLYEKGAPTTSEARSAFCKWVSAALHHFKGRGILWEMWNEPNGGFWLPHADVQQYVKLALQTGETFRRTAPSEWFIGPGMSGMDMNFLENCFKSGMLKYWDAVSFHPYRLSAPETAAADFRTVRALIARYAPAGRHVPLLSSEWGYSEVYPGLNLARQTRWAVREFLSNMASHLRLSIWYDWHDDGTDPKNAEHHFGTVYNDYKKKTTYLAVQNLAHTLQGFLFNKRLQLASKNDYCLLFSKGREQRLAVWTTEAQPHTVVLPLSPGRASLISMLGVRSKVKAGSNGLLLRISHNPRYVIPSSNNMLLTLAAAWRSVPPVLFYRPNVSVKPALLSLASIQLPAALRKNITVSLSLTAPSPMPAHLSMTLVHPGKEGGSLPQAVYICSSDSAVTVEAVLHAGGAPQLKQRLYAIPLFPITLRMYPPMGGKIAVKVHNSAGFSYNGVLSLYADSTVFKRPVHLQAGEKNIVCNFSLPTSYTTHYWAGLINRQYIHSMTLGVYQAVTRPEAFQPFGIFHNLHPGQPLSAVHLDVLPDGDPAIGSQISSSIAVSPNGLQGRTAPVGSVEYSFEKGWKFLRVTPDHLIHLPPFTNGLGMWVYGDGEGCILRMRYTDSTGQAFQPSGYIVNWKGWRYVQFDMQGEGGHWGGAKDGIVHPPLLLDTLLLLDGGGRRVAGHIYFAAPTLIEAASAENK